MYSGDNLGLDTAASAKASGHGIPNEELGPSFFFFFS
jgi:hypothetical protein